MDKRAVEDFIHAFAWFTSNVDLIKSPLDAGDAAVKALGFATKTIARCIRAESAQVVDLCQNRRVNTQARTEQRFLRKPRQDWLGS